MVKVVAIQDWLVRLGCFQVVRPFRVDVRVFPSFPGGSRGEFLKFIYWGFLILF